MRKVKLISDSTCDLGADLIARYDVGIVPLNVHLGEDEFQDGVNVTAADVFQYVDKTKQLPKTAAASVADFEEEFKKWIDLDYDIVFTGIGSKLSATFMAAKLASESFPEGRIHLVDSLNLSTGIALLVAKGGDAVASGASAQEAADLMTSLVPKVRAGFIVDTVEYLYMGGRCSSLESFMAGMLKLRPRLVVKEGVISSDKKYRGNFDRCLDAYTADIKAAMANADKTRVFITTAVTPGSDLADNDAAKVEASFADMGFGEILKTKAGCVISSHCGPRTLGILYMEE